VYPYSTTSQPLVLIVEIDEAGQLRLNKIETGTTADMELLTEKLEAIFADREQSGISEREVVVDAKFGGDRERYEELISVLEDVKASPIRVITNDR
jgi:biopolymer transport protein ExbD